MNMFWPPLSPISGDPVLEAGLLEGKDWATIQFIEHPWCQSCGLIFDYVQIEPMICTPCMARPHVWTKARSAVVYNEHSRPLILSFKHGGRTDMLNTFAQWMVRVGGECLAGADYLIPVPLHAGRLRARRFNQSLLLARSISKLSDIKVDAHSLKRVRFTQSQGTFNAKGRKRNVAGAFKVREVALERLEGRCVVLVDDVYTTGATLEACTRALFKAGVLDVRVITLARVIKPVDLTM